jgi:adenine-specific DNA-methyltransferase
MNIAPVAAVPVDISPQGGLPAARPAGVAAAFARDERAVVYPGDCLDLLKVLPSGSMQLIVTSPPYNIGKEYERRLDLSDYIGQQAKVIGECCRALAPTGSICWQVGNYVENGYIVPLDALLYPVFRDLGLKMRNRIIWHFEHGLHCSRRFSGRYETIMWFTKTDEYVFHLDDVRVPQKYPGKKYFKGPKTGQFSCNPLGKNPGDLWIIPNVKSNHVEKTEHPCQFPVELIERLVLALTSPGDWVLDPFLGGASPAKRGGRRDRSQVCWAGPFANRSGSAWNSKDAPDGEARLRSGVGWQLAYNSAMASRCPASCARHRSTGPAG